MGWDRSLSDKASAPKYPCLIDERHIVAERYGMVNVPTSVWIDEDGFMARPPEPAGASDMFRGMDRQTFEVPRDAAEAGKRTKSFYVDALCDWIEHGKQKPPRASARGGTPTPARSLARRFHGGRELPPRDLALEARRERGSRKALRDGGPVATRKLELPPAEDRARRFRPHGTIRRHARVLGSGGCARPARVLLSADPHGRDSPAAAAAGLAGGPLSTADARVIGRRPASRDAASQSQRALAARRPGLPRGLPIATRRATAARASLRF